MVIVTGKMLILNYEKKTKCKKWGIIPKVYIDTTELSFEIMPHFSYFEKSLYKLGRVLSVLEVKSVTTNKL